MHLLLLSSIVRIQEHPEKIRKLINENDQIFGMWRNCSSTNNIHYYRRQKNMFSQKIPYGKITFDISYHNYSSMNDT